MKTRRTIVILSLAALLPAIAWAGSLSGRVTRSDTDAAVAGARVLIRGTAFLALTGADGSYQFDSVPNGNYGLTCAADGLRGASTNAVWITDGSTRDFALHPPAHIGTIHGVTSCAGTPCQGVIVTATQGSDTRGIGLSGPGGAYSVEGLETGSYELNGAAYQYLPATVPVELPEPAVDGGTTTVEQGLFLSLGGSYTLGGVVALSDNPLDRSGSTVRCNGQIPTLSTSTNTGGSYLLEEVPAGPLAFTAYRAGYQSSTRIDIMMTGNRSLDFVLRKDGNGSTDPTYTIDGTVSLAVPDGGSAPFLAGSHVSIWDPDGDYRQQVITDSDGNFSLGSIPEGNYQAGASREGYLSQVEDPFALNADRTFNFTLEGDPDYDWGPGADAPQPGCGCGSRPAAGLFLVVLLLLPILRRTWIR